MIIVTVAGKVKPEFRDTFLEHMAELAHIVRQEEGCIKYQQNITAEDPNTLFLYEEWESTGHLLAHLETEHMQEHFAQARPWFEWVDMKTSEATEFTLGTENNG
ncbi:antibiotic biosynthesis monooxygenase [Vibrio sp. JC009]|uniref:putative quinol monooxygenase n=1 Tax=Vibrio sp. JC009 TaxID=2912314 RepID=UPI0023B0EC59|nr:putative quinol monooxygenase [Vibrio sp. JC009]WED23640.1 antibiotic biosynthesis monooxygenase [Vibrio sp. JC009]